MGGGVGSFRDAGTNTPQVVQTANPLPVTPVGAGAFDHKVWGPDANGTPITEAPVLIGARSDDGTVHALRSDTAGQLISPAEQNEGAGGLTTGIQVGGATAASIFHLLRVNTTGQLFTLRDASLYGTFATVLLAGGATFTSPSIDAGTSPIQWNQILFAYASDQASAANAIIIQFSNDNATWFNNVTANPVTLTNLGSSTPANIAARWWRLVYTNGAVAQGTFVVNWCLRS